MKKIAILHYAYPPEVGGVETLVRQQAVILSDLGFNVMVLAGSGKEDTNSFKLIIAEELRSVKKIDPFLYDRMLEDGKLNDEFYDLASQIEKKLEQHLADREVIVVHNMLTLFHNLPFIYAFKKYINKYPQKKIIVWVHDQTYIGFDRTRLNEIKLSADMHKLLTEKIKNAKYVAISGVVKDLLPKVTDLSSDEILIIPNGIDIKEFLEISDPVFEVIQKYNFLESFPLILSPVNVLGRKNLEYSLEIISNLKKIYPNIAYLITGKSSEHRRNLGYVEFLKTKIKEFVLENNVFFLHDIFCRNLTQSEVLDFYNISEMVFHFSKGENFGLPLLESFLTKTPIFVSNLKVFKEIGGEDLNYIDIENKLPKETSKIIESFIEENKILALQNKAKSKYSLKKIIIEKLVPILEA